MATRRQQPGWMIRQPSDGWLDDVKSVPVRRYVAILLPLSAVFGLVFLLAYRSEVADARARVFAEQTALLEGAARRAELRLEIATAELRVVADLVSQAAANDFADGRGMLGRSLASLVDRNPGHLRIRYVTATGRERLRVERTPEGARIASERELRSEADAGPIGATLALAPRELLVAPGERFVRISAPIDTARERRAGIVTLDADPRYLLGGPEQAEAPSESGVRRMVVRTDGSWGRRPAGIGGADEPASSESFESSYPDAWPRLLAAPGSWIEDEDGYFRLEPVMAPPLTRAPGTRGGSPPVWLLVAHVPSRLVGRVALDVATSMLVVATPLFYALLAIGIAGIAYLYRREEALRGLEAVKGAMTASALDGIVVMGDDGLALEFNPSALRIFGYTPEEVAGKSVAELIIPQEHREAHRKGMKRYLATGEARIVGRHIDELTAVRKNGEQFPIELTVCRPISIGRRRVFYGFLRDLTEQRRGRIEQPAERNVV